MAEAGDEVSPRFDPLLRLGDFGAAASAFQRAIALNPDLAGSLGGELERLEVDQPVRQPVQGRYALGRDALANPDRFADGRSAVPCRAQGALPIGMRWKASGSAAGLP